MIYIKYLINKLWYKIFDVDDNIDLGIKFKLSMDLLYYLSLL